MTRFRRTWTARLKSDRWRAVHVAPAGMERSSSRFTAATEPLRTAGAPQAAVTAAWQAAELAERLAHCELLRQMFGFQSKRSGENP